MQDLPMCMNTDCALRGGCHRYLAVPDPLWPSFCRYEPLRGPEGLVCDLLLPARPGHDRLLAEADAAYKKALEN